MGLTFCSALLAKAVTNWEEPEKKRIQSMWLGMRDRQISEARMQFELALCAEHPHEELRSLHVIMQGRPSFNETQESPISFSDIRISPEDVRQILMKKWLQLKKEEQGSQPGTREHCTAMLGECQKTAELFGLSIGSTVTN